MGRHSIPDPEDFDREPEYQIPADEPVAPIEYADSGEDPREPADYFAPVDYPDHIDYPEPTDYSDHTDYPEPADYRDQPDYRDEPDYGDQPDYTDGVDIPAPVAPEYRPPAAEPVRAAFSADPSGPSTSGHRTAGEWTGSHRVVDPGRRGVSLGVIAALVGVVAVVAGVILWRFFGDALSDRSVDAAGRCLGGNADVAVVADPAIADQLSTFAKQFNETAGPVGDKCVVVSVAPGDSTAVTAGLLGAWPDALGAKPALWVPGSSVASARLQAAGGPKSVSSARSLATSPVLLAVNPELKTALADQTWATLPTLQNDPAALDGLGLPGWGPLRLALPATGDSDASYLAAEAVAAAGAPAGGPATAGVAAVTSLMTGAPKLADGSLDTAFNALVKSSDPAAAQVHAVALTEQQLFARSSALPDADKTVAGWLPPGAAPVADFPAVLLAGDWVDDEVASAASEFERYLHKPEQLAALAKAGFRTEGNTPVAAGVTPFAPLTGTLSIGDDATRVSVANAVGGPVTPAQGAPAATGAVSTTSIMLDRSLNLAPVVAALNTRIAALPPASAVGLTAFDGGQGSALVNVGPLSDPVDGQTRGNTITATLSGLESSGGGAVSFTTLRNVLADAQTNFRPGQTNSVLVITAGPHTDQSLGAEGLQDLVRSTADPARPVAVNVINIGDDPDRPTWESVAQLSGGSYRNVAAADSPDLAAALTAMLG